MPMNHRPLLAVLASALFLAGCGADDGAPEGRSQPRGSDGQPSESADPVPAGLLLKPGSPAGPASLVPFAGEVAPPVVKDGIVLRVLAEGEIAADGTMTMQAMEQDLIYLMAQIETESGDPVEGAGVRVTTASANQIFLEQDRTDDWGYAAFTLFVSEPGVAEFTLSIRGVETRFRIDVMRLDDSPWLQGIQGPGITPWTSLRAARIHFGEGGSGSLRADFAADLVAMEGQQVSLAGYMMPMTPDMRQTAFLLSASPPSCFFHPPGGPTTMVLVETSPLSPVPMTMDPLVVRGRLALVRESEDWILYRLTEAGPEGSSR